ncbi:archaellin/type IV pilin N-terminal domain-containing protein [Halalkaliarchaeum sp. AArc-GB]|uniref:archaellin/type IV pilin N-terminal domain-containing protein n=1 Tax=Halalkaliarchaeum sp. AArc-GB TaxID=3074078 RepID=UPI00285D8169|nr:archaellin/type IV pilin N-terminal domain-containing protein [Halalkaliarchaeum sp. AArc-GB]MDR5672843.1 archaellin/type IV pilin N-terminal domain-containing protein [Halalkaliarchaeum sp. AArc-GB]
MFEFMQEEERGQVGIGTLIVFIAMVLVAAIAAGVLINTAGFLQTQAEATGQESTSQVSDRLDVVSSVGVVNETPDDDQLNSINVSVTTAAGADQIDLNETTIQIVGPNGQDNLVANTDATGVDQLGPSEFGIKDPDGAWVTDPSEAVVDNDRFTLIINPQEGGSAVENFGQGDQAQLDIVAPSSATTSETLNAPDLFGDPGSAVIL